MANDFSGDSNCKAVWPLDSADITADIQNTETLTNSGVSADTGDFKEGDASGDFVGASNDRMFRTDANLAADFPLADGDTTKIISGCVWVKFTSLSGGDMIWGKWESSPADFSFWIGAWVDDKVAMFIGTGPSSTANFITNITVVTGRWYHISVSYRDSDKAAHIRVWDDTAEDIQDETLTMSDFIHLTDGDFSLGQDQDGAFQLDAKVDELAIFNDVLTSGEMDEIRQGIFGAPAFETKTYTADTNISATETKTYTADVNITAAGSDSYSADVNIAQDGALKTYTSDVNIANAARYTADVNIRILTSKRERSHFVDSDIQGTSGADSWASGTQNRTTAMPQDYSHLNGEIVQLLQDGVHTANQTVAGGSVTTTGTTNHIGLRYDTKIQPMKIDGEITTKRISLIIPDFFETVGGKHGDAEDNLYSNVLKASGDPLDEDDELFDGHVDIPFDGGYQRNADIWMVQEDPFPMTVRGLGVRFSEDIL